MSSPGCPALIWEKGVQGEHSNFGIPLLPPTPSVRASPPVGTAQTPPGVHGEPRGDGRCCLAEMGLPGARTWGGPVAAAPGGFGDRPPPQRGGPGGSAAVHGLGQEGRKIWGFSPPAPSQLPGWLRRGGGGGRHRVPLGVTASPQTREQHSGGTQSSHPGRPQRFASRHAGG